MQDAMIAPATRAPAEAPIRMDEIGCVDPRIAPNRPATTASAGAAKLPNPVIFLLCSSTMQPAPAASPVRKPIALKQRYPNNVYTIPNTAIVVQSNTETVELAEAVVVQSGFSIAFCIRKGHTIEFVSNLASMDAPVLAFRSK